MITVISLKYPIVHQKHHIIVTFIILYYVMLLIVNLLTITIMNFVFFLYTYIFILFTFSVLNNFFYILKDKRSAIIIKIETSLKKLFAFQKTDKSVYNHKQKLVVYFSLIQYYEFLNTYLILIIY